MKPCISTNTECELFCPGGNWLGQPGFPMMASYRKDFAVYLELEACFISLLAGSMSSYSACLLVHSSLVDYETFVRGPTYSIRKLKLLMLET